MLIYFAHPIDQAGQSARGRIVADIAQTLHEVGLSVYQPGTAFTVSDSPLPDLERIDEINQQALFSADALLAWLPGGVATLGVPAEIEAALMLNKPVVVLTTPGLVAKAVQMVSWRKRGVQIETWTEGIARRWEANGAILADMLRTPPRPEPHALVDVTGLGQDKPETLPGQKADPSDLMVTLDPAASEPARAYHDDAGLDLAILHEERLAAGERRMLPTGIRAAIPSGWWGLIIGRSSTLVKHNCQVELGVIDAGYRGELMIQLTNRGDSAMVFEAGTRLAQYVLIPTFPGHVVQVDQLPEAHRGEQGYGSSGR